MQHRQGCSAVAANQVMRGFFVRLWLLRHVAASALADVDDMVGGECASRTELASLKGEVAMLRAATEGHSVDDLRLQLANARADLAMATMLKQGNDRIGSTDLEEELAEAKVMLTAADSSRSEMAATIARLEAQLSTIAPDMERLRQEAADARQLRSDLAVAQEALASGPSIAELDALRAELTAAKENVTLLATVPSTDAPEEVSCQIANISSTWADCDGLHEQLAATKKQFRDSEHRAGQLQYDILRLKANCSQSLHISSDDDGEGRCSTLQEELMAMKAALEVADVFRDSPRSDGSQTGWEDAWSQATARVQQLRLDFERRDQRAVAIVAIVAIFMLLLAIGCLHCMCDSSF
mmetsp:Transcript_29094/g.66932  ORF Transcript_29094/g.66932 Transcript_29094/m.66932 type:complete len:354 (-) Transcript_29094:59-1120(-)